MNLDRWQRIDKIVQDALERAPQERAQFLESVCADDPSIRQEAQTLIRSFELAGNFLEFPAPGSITGRTFGQYEIKRLIGSGGMGQVYLGWDSKLKRDVAIKVLPTVFSHDTERVARFQREAEVLASLNHPHIAAIYDVSASRRTAVFGARTRGRRNTHGSACPRMRSDPRGAGHCGADCRSTRSSARKRE